MPLEKITDWLNAAGDFSLHRLLPAVLLLISGILIVRIILRILGRMLNRTKLEKAAISLIRSVTRIVLNVLVLLTVASFLGIDITGIVALASVLTLAISLSLQDALTNLIGGFTLLSTKPFSTDDFVEIDGQSGTVKEVGLTYTKLLTSDGKIISLPNSTVVSAKVINYTTSGIRRVDITVSAAYSCKVEDVLAALRKAADVPTALPDREPYVAVSAYGEHAISYILQIWSTSGDYWTTLHTVNRHLQSVFEENRIQMTYPHLNVHLDK